jgi:Acetyltransferase (GNAT) domain
VSVLSVSCVEGVTAIQQFAGDIDRLNLASARPNPFLSAAFLLCYSQQAEYHVPGKEERLYLIHEADRLIGIAPMRRSLDDVIPPIGPMHCRGARLTLLAPLDTERPGVLAAPQDEERVTAALVQYLCRQERSWGMLEFVGQPPGAALYKSIHAASNHKFRARDITVEPYTEIEIVWVDLNGYFRSLAKKMRSNISRQARRLFAHGEPELVLAQGAPAVAAWFDAYCDLDSRSWKHGTSASILRHPRRLGFYKEIIAGRAGLDPSFIGIVLDGALVAGLIVGSDLLGNPDRRGAWFLEMTYDQSRADLGPGQLLLLLGVGQALDRGERFVNFMQNFAYYKHRWGAAIVPVVSVQLIRRASLHNARALLGDLRKHLLSKSGRKTNGESPAQADEQPREDDSPSNPAPDLVRARQVTAQALAYDGPGLRRLDRQAARAYLPFDLE